MRPEKFRLSSDKKFKEEIFGEEAASIRTTI
jgi:hypothetical protein